MNCQPFFKFPMKPIRASWSIFKTLDPEKYTLEPKYDGFRAIVQVGKEVTLWTRDKVQMVIPNNLVSQLAELDMPEGTLLDGEIWNMSKRGSWRHNPKEVCALTLWDTIRFAKRDLSNEPIEVRRKHLEDLLQGKNTPDIKSTEILPVDEMLTHKMDEEAHLFRENSKARSGFIHGVVIKRRGSPRRDHVTRCIEHCDWVKLVFNINAT